MKFKFSVFAKTVPAICIVGGIALIVISRVGGMDGLLIALGVFLLLVGIGLQALYLFLKYRGQGR